MKAVTPAIDFDGNAGEAFHFYQSVFGGAFSTVIRFRDLGSMEEIPEHELDKIAYITLPLGNGHMLVGSDRLEYYGKPLVVGNNFYITLKPESAEKAERLFNALSDGGKVEMPLDETEWAEKFGMFADKFGVQWILHYTGNMQFNGGQAERHGTL